MENKKIKFTKGIFHLAKDSSFRWKDIKNIPFEDDDEINIQYVEAFYSENNSWDAYYLAEVTREEEETDEQFQERMDKIELSKKWSKKLRYQNYLKLKEEFENGE